MRTNLEKWLLWVGSIGTALVCMKLATAGTWNPDYSLANEEFNANFYREQALSFLNGHLDVPADGYTWTECSWVHKECVVYFGLTPSLLRVPTFLFGSDAPNLTPLFITLAIFLTMWAVLDLQIRILQRLIPDPEKRRIPSALMILPTTLLLGVGSTLTFLSKPRMYHEAILWMIAFLLVTMNFVYRWLVTRRRVNLVVALFAAVAAANARPSGAIASLALGAGVVLVLVLDRRQQRVARTDYGLAGGLAVLPAATSGAVLWLKFGSIIQDMTVYYAPWSERVMKANNGNLQGFRFLFTNLANYFRPDSIRYQLSSPWIIEQVPAKKPPIVVSPIVVAGLQVEPLVSLTNAMTAPLFLTAGFTVLALFGIVRMEKTDRRAFFILGTTGALSCGAVLTYFSLSTRYLGDFYPLLAIGTIFALAYLARWLQRRFLLLSIASAVLTLIALGSFFLQLQLTTMA